MTTFKFYQGLGVLIIITSVVPDPTIGNGHPFQSKDHLMGRVLMLTSIRWKVGPCGPEDFTGFLCDTPRSRNTFLPSQSIRNPSISSINL
jgi:hypothetical protein